MFVEGENFTPPQYLTSKIIMNNPIRRNKNIGTKNQGFKSQNKFDIPFSYQDSKMFYERLGKTSKIIREINGQKMTFIVEQTRKNCCHACTIEDIETILKNISNMYYEGLNTFIFRQPKVKEEIFSPVWGRLIYLYELEKENLPVIILEAANYSKPIIWDRKLSIENQKEFRRLQEDGYDIEENKKKYEIKLTINNVRNTQLYRTFLHELGHYFHFITTNFDIYENIPKLEKEVFANNFADKMKLNLEVQNIIPFERMLNQDSLLKDGLWLTDFQL